MNRYVNSDRYYLDTMPDEQQYLIPPCILCSDDCSRPEAWICDRCETNLHVQDELLPYENKAKNSGVTAYYVHNESESLFVEFNSKVVYQYQKKDIGNQLYQDMITKAEAGFELSRLIYKLQPKYSQKFKHTDFESLAHGQLIKERPLILKSDQAREDAEDAKFRSVWEG